MTDPNLNAAETWAELQEAALDRRTPTEDVREGVEKLLTPIVAVGMSDASQLTAGQIREVRDAITAFIAAREAAKDAEIERLRKVEDDKVATLGNMMRLEAERDTLAARLEKANGIINDLLGLPLDNGHACVVDLVSEHVDAATEFLEGWSPDGSTPVPASETALHDGTKE